jgi:pimeloyl-ACP methyl ester carboxylesterase
MKVEQTVIDIEVEDTAEINPQDTDAYHPPGRAAHHGPGHATGGLAAQLVDELVDAGFRVIRMDNRDIGLSQHFDHLGKPNILMAGIRYKLGLRIAPAIHAGRHGQRRPGCARCPGGGQRPHRGCQHGRHGRPACGDCGAAAHVLSLTSIMSSSGARGLKRGPARCVAGAFESPRQQRTGGRGGPLREACSKPLAVRVSRSLNPTCVSAFCAGVERCYHPVGTLAPDGGHHLRTPTRAEQLGAIKSPTLVLHGRADPLVPFEHGEDVAQTHSRCAPGRF